jgi:bifunctional non-homologous end joining protein LigD
VLELLGAAAPGLQVPDTLSGTGTEALEQSLDRGWEGVIAKRRDSLYLPGKRGTAWIKAKNWLTQEVVVAGYRPGQGVRSGTFGALLLGVYEGDDLVFVGRVGSGFDDRTLTTLTESLQRLRRRTSPFAEHIPTADARGAVWVTPRLVGEVRFQSWTDGGRLRHPIWRGLRDDIEASDVRRADS